MSFPAVVHGYKVYLVSAPSKGGMEIDQEAKTCKEARTEYYRLMTEYFPEKNIEFKDVKGHRDDYYVFCPCFDIKVEESCEKCGLQDKCKDHVTGELAAHDSDHCRFLHFHYPSILGDTK